MSPEALDGTDLTSASDMYSFGCVLFELLSGQHLYVIDDAASAREPIGVASDEKFDEAPLASLPSFHGEGAERSLQQALLDNEVPVEQKRIELRALRRKRLVSIIVNTGKRPPLPPHWPSKLQELLIMCWDRTPGRRPTAAIAVEFLRDNLRDLEELGNFAAVAAPRNVGAPEIASSQ
jgi:serine/threonine protein kinase